MPGGVPDIFAHGSVSNLVETVVLSRKRDSRGPLGADTLYFARPETSGRYLFLTDAPWKGLLPI